MRQPVRSQPKLQCCIVVAVFHGPATSLTSLRHFLSTTFPHNLIPSHSQLRVNFNPPPKHRKAMTCCRERLLSRATQVLALLAFCAALRYVAWRWRRVVDTSYWVRYVERGRGMCLIRMRGSTAPASLLRPNVCPYYTSCANIHLSCQHLIAFRHCCTTK